MSIESWLDLGTPERVDDAITDMEQLIDRFLEVGTWISRRVATRSEAVEKLIDAHNGLIDLISDLRAHIAEAEEAKSHLPDYDATDSEKSRHARGRG